MKRLMLIGPSQCGKTSLTQVLRGETLRYQKTQAIVWTPAAIDTPGEYLENRCLYSALLTSACEADVIALVLNADAPRLQQVRTWLEAAGAGHIFITSALTGDGLDDLFACLNAEEYQ
ncbi:propanediol utilization protein PduV [Klebsiella pneumoniae]|uniref:propanediol utilization protein PduV n=1 Tax=Klebsiella pneumoniae TaxID=573 RepID=UPI0010336BCC|nr:propanediol utilization protein PduV [Klebsiella pneumoniae]